MSESRQKDRFQKEEKEAEGLLWARLRDGHGGHKFRHQVTVGPYIADFLSLPLKLIVDIDAAHSDNKRNEARVKVLKTLGYEVIRLKDSDVLANVDAALAEITKALSQREKATKK